jgi:hypothetical protein
MPERALLRRVGVLLHVLRRECLAPSQHAERIACLDEIKRLGIPVVPAEPHQHGCTCWQCAYQPRSPLRRQASRGEK